MEILMSTGAVLVPKDDSVAEQLLAHGGTPFTHISFIDEPKEAPRVEKPEELPEEKVNKKTRKNKAVETTE